MPSTCQFFYDNPNSVYYSGQIVKGKVVLKTDKVKSVRAIYLTIKGNAKVRWTERKSRHNHHTGKQEHYTEHYRGDQQYLHSQTMVESDIDLPAGTHEYTFMTPLPMQIPSSITGEYGHVSYEVELKLDRPLRLDNVYSNGFTVIHPLNLNLDPAYLHPIITEEEKYFCCCCCKSGPMNSELRTEFSGYAPGQKINFTVLIDNEANKDIDGCSVELIQKMSFQSHTPEHKTKHVENVISSTTLGGVNRLSKKLHQGSIEVPPLPPSTIGSINIIDVSYVLKAEIETGFCSTNEDLYAPITIGTVPLMASATNPNNVITIQPTAPSIDLNEDGDSKPPNYGSLVPPSFEEATGISATFIDPEDDTKRDVEPFLPKYPMYHNFAIPSAPYIEDRPATKKTESPAASPLLLETESVVPAHGLPYPVEGFHIMPNPTTSTTENSSVIGWHLK